MIKPVIKGIVRTLLQESMFPKEFDRNRLGSCMAAAEMATKYLLKRGIKDFQVVEGWVAFSDDYEITQEKGRYYTAGSAFDHTWIEFKNGRTFDPTKKQWIDWGYDPKESKVVKIKTKYTPEEYLEACEWEPSDWRKFKKQTNEIRLEPPVDVTIREVVKVRDEKQKQQLIKNLIPRLKDDNVILSVSKSKEVPEASYVQVDFIIKGQNILSTNAENMIRNGFRMPTTQQLLSVLNTGRYKMSDLKGKLTENMTYDQLLKLTASTPRSPDDNTNRIDRAKNVRARSIPVSMEENMEQWNFRYKSNPSVTNKPFEGQITFLKGDVERKDDAMELECKVDCGCPDYRYKFAYNNYKQGAGDIGPDTLNKCINQAPQKPYDIGEGLCKHLTALRGYLQTKIAATQKSNLFEAINEVAQQGPFNITYYD